MVMPQLMVKPVGQTARIPRKPKHQFYLEHRPWQIQPFAIVPVLPAETMKNALLQTRAVTDPIISPLTGWWLDYWLFYVKLRDLADREDFSGMMVDFDKDMSSHKEGAFVQRTYTPKSGMKWVQYCLDRVVEEYFRDENETGTFEIDNMPVAQLGIENFSQSGGNFAEFDTGGADVDVDLNADSTITASEIEKAQRQWMIARHEAITEMSFEDYLRAYGVRAPEAIEPHRPEMIRYWRNWTYPSNTVDHTDGSVSSACSWSVAGRADKDRRFDEPGFIFGVTVARPKIYFQNQKGCGAALMNSAFSWLPAMLKHDTAISWQQIANGDGPFENITDADGYLVDIRDLLIHGDQFTNVDLATVSDLSLAALPATDFQRRFASAADAAALFVDSDGPNYRVRQDGILDLTILGTQMDHTP